MANIGQFKVGDKWKKIDEVIGVALAANSSYTIQNKGYAELLICIVAEEPQDKEVGFIIQTGQSFGYTCEEGNYLRIRALSDTAEFNIAEGI